MKLSDGLWLLCAVARIHPGCGVHIKLDGHRATEVGSWAELTSSSTSCFADRDGAVVTEMGELDHAALATVQCRAHPNARPMPDRFHANTHGLGWGTGRSWDPWVTALPGGSHRVYFLTSQHRQEGEEWWARSQLATAYGERLGAWSRVQLVTLQGVDPSRQRVLAGSTEWHQGQFYLTVTTGTLGSRREDGVQLFVSSNGWDFQPLQGWEHITPKLEWYHSSSHDWMYLGWRDPFVFHDPATKHSYLIWSAGLPWNGSASSWDTCWLTDGTHKCHKTQYQACIAAATLRQPLWSGWELQPPLVSPVLDTRHHRRNNPRSADPKGSTAVFGPQSGFWEMERPQILYHGGRYHLFFSCYSWHVNPDWLRVYNAGRTPDSSALFHYVAQSMDSSWHPASPSIVEGSEGTGLYGLHFVPAGDGATHWVFGWYRGEISLEVGTKFKLEWSDAGIPIIRRSPLA